MGLFDQILAGASQAGAALLKGDTSGAIAGAGKVTGAIYDDLGKNVGDLVSSGGNLLAASEKKHARDAIPVGKDGTPGKPTDLEVSKRGASTRPPPLSHRRAGGGVFLLVPRAVAHG